MPVHDVTMNLSHPITVKNVDVEFEVRSDGELQGKVQISKGGIDWTPFKIPIHRGDLGAVRRVDGGIRLNRCRPAASASRCRSRRLLKKSHLSTRDLSQDLVNWWVQGQSESNPELLDAAALCRQLVPEGTVEAFLADHQNCFLDQMFEDLFPSGSRVGDRLIPADVVASVMVLQALEGLSDRDAVRALRGDRISWKVPLRPRTR